MNRTLGAVCVRFKHHRNTLSLQPRARAHAQTLDPHGDGGLPKELHQVGRDWFAVDLDERRPGHFAQARPTPGLEPGPLITSDLHERGRR